jgi:two-component system, OmpR family, alkaline phosphatase synthesis response regulator PhoP
MTAHILLVEDEQHLADGIRENLEAEGYTVQVSTDGEDGLLRWQTQPLDLVILDVMLPRLDGFSVCERIRNAGGHVPILFLTAKNTEDDRIHGLKLGGDDYLGKPFALRELLTRVAAMLRRQSWYNLLPTQQAQIAGFQVNFRTYEIHKDGNREILGQKEAMILKLLLEHPNEVVSREEILDHVWGYDVFPSTRTVDNFIVRLRKRFEANPDEPQYIHTVRGVGYRYVPESA